MQNLQKFFIRRSQTVVRVQQLPVEGTLLLGCFRFHVHFSYFLCVHALTEKDKHINDIHLCIITFGYACTVRHFLTFASISPLMRQAHQDRAAAFWYSHRNMALRNITAHDSLQIKKDFAGTEDDTNYQLFIVLYCCVYCSLIIFGGRPQQYISFKWNSSFEAFHFVLPY